MRDTSERRQQIISEMRERGSVQVASLAKKFAVSVQTIRKDLEYLAQRGVAERSYGGAILASEINVATEAPLDAKRSVFFEEKERIGKLAASLVLPGESVVLDSGTTTMHIAEALADDEDITVVTNDFDILAVLTAKSRINVIMLGGALRRKNMAFYGTQTVAALDDLHVDKLFLGVDGFDIDRGITTHYEPEALLNRKMVEAAGQVIAVTDRSKFGRVCLHRILNIDEVDALVTDGPVDDAIRSASAQFGFDIHTA
ncbi:MAG: transcriptional repressor AgaR [Tsuneonella suprasediminis]|nr:transcriptional repressor AgaR [Tsuneonella suprasediminis]UBS34410.1 DeoR/GlpR family DNA-binding transcription regulator [Altererythrobacter sp. N1]